MASTRPTVCVFPCSLTLPASIRPADTKTGGHVQAQRGHRHARRDLFAIGDADQGVDAMGICHVFDTVSDELTRWQAVKHAVMTHRDAVINRDGVEFLGDATCVFDLAGNELPKILQMDMARHE